ncbi:hypothetical protein THTE_4079 [Thermogutta terrifontis]|uniref:Uncharacterized protein n=1 Tax=Thermogutta terrifontis TaxID=1331910 RepID=A0A286RL33_9BACT|nr:hypothetical protein THTE_4079 [Thermogutta terrifontis]
MQRFIAAFWVKALAFTTVPLAVFCRDHDKRPPVGAIHELALHRQRDLFRRDPLVGSDEHRLITHPFSPGTTSVPLRPFSGGTCLSGPYLRRDLLVRSVCQRPIMDSVSAGTEVPR